MAQQDISRFLKQNREQVGDLPGRGVRPANIRGGTVGVVVQQAEEPAIMGLARSLNGVNKALQNYHSMGATVSEMEEKRIMSMTPEERAEELNKTKAKLDGAERKGLIPFLGNPLNWERNKKALAVGLAGDLYDEMTSDTGRLKNPKQHDDTRSLDEIVGEEVQSFLGENPAIEGQQIVLDEFYRAFEVKNRAIQREYGERQAGMVKGNIVKKHVNEIFRFWDDWEGSAGEATLIQTQMLENWEPLQFLTQKEKLDVISKLATSLAKSSPEHITDFMEAFKSLPVGNATYGQNSKHFSDLDNIVTVIAQEEEERQQKETDRERTKRKQRQDDSIEQLNSDFYAGMQSLRSGVDKFNWKGQDYTDVDEFDEAFREHMDTTWLQEDTQVYAGVIRGINEYLDAGNHNIVGERLYKQAGVERVISTTVSRLSRTAILLDKDKEIIDAETGENFLVSESPDFLEIEASLYTELDNLAQTIRDEVSQSGVGFLEQADTFKQRFRDESAEILTEHKERVQAIGQAQKDISKQYNEADAALKNAKDGDKVATAPSNWVGESPLQATERINHNLTLAIVSTNKSTQSKALKEAITWINVNDLRSRANGSTPKQRAKTITTDFGRTITTSELSYTDDEKETFRLLAERVEALSGFYTDIDALEQQRTITGVAFDPTELNPFQHFILTKEETELDEPNDMIKRKAEIIKDISAEDLLKAQKKVYEQRKHLLPLIDG